MEIRQYTDQDINKLYKYWQQIGERVPYFFNVSRDKWHQALVEDKLDGQPLFKDIQTYLALENEQVVGFVQFGQPNFYWDDNGKKFYDPDVGVIRHLFYDKNNPEVGETLLNKAIIYLNNFKYKDAFFHIFGMSCNAHHGKLYNEHLYIEELLTKYGFKKDHENIYYTLDLDEVQGPAETDIEIRSEMMEDVQKEIFSLYHQDERIGSAEIRYLERLTGGLTQNTAYLTWIVMAELARGKGFGSKFINLLAQNLKEKGFKSLHADTADDNHFAQQFYNKNNFKEDGYSRSYAVE